MTLALASALRRVVIIRCAVLGLFMSRRSPERGFEPKGGLDRAMLDRISWKLLSGRQERERERERQPLM